MSALDMQRRYLPGPRMISPLPDENRQGMIAIFTCSLISVITTGSLLTWLTYRLVFWRRYYTRYPGHNQFIVLVFNLLLADLHQASSLMVSPHWLRMDEISTYSPACFAQGWLINFGDVASGLFVLAIAIHTFATVITRKTLRHGVFVGCVVGLWVFCLILTTLAPALRGRYVFVPTGAWCWIDSQFGDERLYLHYFWIFVTEIGIIIIYPTLFFIIRHRLKTTKEFKSITGSSRPKFNRVLKIMIIYPVAYIVISLPVAAGRMSMMNGHHPGMPYFYFTGSLLMCSGWVDSILYFLTRRRLLEADIPTENESSKSSNSQKCDQSYDIPPTIGGGALRGIDNRHKPTSSSLKNSRAPPTASSSTDQIIGSVDLPELGRVNHTTPIEFPSDPARAASSSLTSSSSNRQPSDSLPPSASSIDTSNILTPPRNTKKLSTKYQMRWAS